MSVIARRALLAGTGVAAATAVSVTAARLLRKPQAPAPTVVTLQPDTVHLRPISALQPIDPPRDLPAITWVDGHGTPHVQLNDVGMVIVLNLWATWCAPCVAEMPALAALARTAPPGLLVLPIATDAGGAPVVETFYRTHGITGLPIALDPKGTALQTLGVRGLPTTFILDREGRARAKLEGAADWDSPDALATIRRLVR